MTKTSKFVTVTIALILLLIAGFFAAVVFINAHTKSSQQKLQYEAFMPMHHGNAVDIVNYQTGKVLDTISAKTIPGAVNSHGLAVSKDGRRIYVASMNKTFVSVYDVSHHKLITNVNVGFKTHHMAIDPLGRYVYVTQYKGNKVAVISTKTNKLVKSIVTGKGSYYPAASLDGKTLYVTDKMANNVAFIDLNTMKVIRTVKVGLSPSHIAVDPTSGDIYVTNEKSNTISIVTPDGTSSKQVPVGTKPHGIGVVHGKILVANSGSNNLSVIDKSTLKTSTSSLGKDPEHLAVTPNDQDVLIQVTGDKKLFVLDAKTLKIQREIQLKFDGHQIGIPSA